MIEYLKFWLSQAAVDIAIGGAAVLVLLICALWSLRKPTKPSGYWVADEKKPKEGQ